MAKKSARSRDENFSAVEFFQGKEVFTLEEFVAEHSAAGRTRSSSLTTLKFHLSTGRIRSMRRGLYATGDFPDPCLVASKLVPDAVLAYDGALAFHDLFPVQHSVHLLTAHRLKYFSYSDVIYSAVSARSPRREEHVVKGERAGQPVYATSRERTLVDMLDRIDLLHDPSDLWKAFRQARSLDFGAMLHRAKKLDRAVTYARLGLFLDNLRGADRKVVEQLAARVPKSAAYFNRKDREEDDEKPAEYVLERRWNLVLELDFLLHLEGKNPNYKARLNFLNR